MKEITCNQKKRHLKTWVKVLITIFTLIIILLVAGLIIYSYLLSAVSSKSKIVNFKVEEGTSVYAVGDQLKKEKLIRSTFAYKLYVKLNNVSMYNTGTYKIDASTKTSDIIKLLEGDSYKQNGITITFKEGKTIRKVASEIAQNTNITESEFYSTMEDDAYIDTLISKYWFLTNDIKNENIYYSLEGYLYPDTYNFNDGVTAKEIIEVMLNQADKVFSKYKNQINDSNLTIHEIVTLSSLVESEGIYEDDRKMIAGVFYNRLNSNMPLGSDVTTYYACKIELGQRDLTAAELATPNPYNTRGSGMEGKLPVGAISNFGESSFKATLNPTKNNYYYFVADKSGKTHFTKTYEEHQKIIKELKEADNWIEW